MLEIYYARTPNGVKPLLFAAEYEIEATLHPVNLGQGEQFSPEFLAISPNNKIPAIIDSGTAIFESGAILQYLAEKYAGLGENPRKYEIVQWLYWQTGGLGPIGGQSRFFREGAPEKVPFAIERFSTELERLNRVLDGHLERNAFVSGASYHIADMMIYPWVLYNRNNGISIEHFEHLSRWFDTVAQRASVRSTYETHMAS